MERELGKDLEQGKKRVAFLMDNCDAVEEKGRIGPHERKPFGNGHRN